jgi:hypothetical protein
MKPLMKLILITTFMLIGSYASAFAPPPPTPVNAIRANVTSLFDTSFKPYLCTLITSSGDSWFSNLIVETKASNLTDAAKLAVTPFRSGQDDLQGLIKISYKNNIYYISDVKCAQQPQSI